MRLVCVALLASIPATFLRAEADAERDRNAIIAVYNRSLEAMNRGDAETALRMETGDWVSITLGQKPVTIQELAPLIRRDIASMKNPPGWTAYWKPDYEKNGTDAGIQIYDIKFEGDRATVLYLIGNTHSETIDGTAHRIWNGSHVRDSWISTVDGWKRRKHEKLTVNERMVDGKTVAVH